MSAPLHLPDDHDQLARLIGNGLGRRAMLRAAAAGAVGSAVVPAVAAGAAEAQAAPRRGRGGGVRVLQPGTGPTRGRYVTSGTGEGRSTKVRWRAVPPAADKGDTRSPQPQRC